jgi:hypothetical protein
MYNSKMVASIKCNGKVMREHGDTVYLPFNSDFTIFLKNLNTKRVQVNITIDGEDVLDGSCLIINAGESLDLKRWLLNGDMKTGPKFRFIEKTEGIRETRGEGAMDGLIEITYQYEKPWYVGGSYHGGPYFNDPFNPTFGYRNDASIGSSLGGPSGGTTTGATYRSSVNYCTANLGTFNDANEDGLTVKGEDTQQEFSSTFMGALETEKYSIVLQLKGDVNQEKVRKPITVKTKITCPVCKKRQSSNNKFCSQCGNNLKY